MQHTIEYQQHDKTHAVHNQIRRECITPVHIATIIKEHRLNQCKTQQSMSEMLQTHAYSNDY